MLLFPKVAGAQQGTTMRMTPRKLPMVSFTGIPLALYSLVPQLSLSQQQKKLGAASGGEPRHVALGVAALRHRRRGMRHEPQLSQAGGALGGRTEPGNSSESFGFYLVSPPFFSTPPQRVPSNKHTHTHTLVGVSGLSIPFTEDAQLRFASRSGNKATSPCACGLHAP